MSLVATRLANVMLQRLRSSPLNNFPCNSLTVKWFRQSRLLHLGRLELESYAAGVPLSQHSSRPWALLQMFLTWLQRSTMDHTYHHWSLSQMHGGCLWPKCGGVGEFHTHHSSPACAIIIQATKQCYQLYSFCQYLILIVVANTDDLEGILMQSQNGSIMGA